MRAMNSMVMAGIMIGCMGCSSMLPKVDASRPIAKSGNFFGPRYMQDGEGIDPGDMADKLEQEPEAAPHVQRSRGLRVVSTILSAAGGALMGWTLGEMITGESRPNWKLAAIGGGATIVALPLAIWSDFSMDQAVEAHNNRSSIAFAKTSAPPVTGAAKRQWKPGERAGAQSKPKDAFGFVFGTSKTDAAAACQKAGYQWSEAEGVTTCTGTPSTAISGASAQVEFGAGGLSSVEVIITPPSDAGGWAGMFRKSEGALTQLYGKPTQRSFVVPNDCKAEDSFLGCVADGKVTGSSLWYLDADHAATLSIVAMPLPSTSTLRVRIGRPRANP